MQRGNSRGGVLILLFDYLDILWGIGRQHDRLKFLAEFEFDYLTRTGDLDNIAATPCKHADLIFSDFTRQRHSDFKEFTGFALAARQLCRLTVATAIIRTRAPPAGNSHQGNGAL